MPARPGGVVNSTSLRPCRASRSAGKRPNGKSRAGSNPLLDHAPHEGPRRDGNRRARTRATSNRPDVQPFRYDNSTTGPRKRPEALQLGRAVRAGSDQQEGAARPVHLDAVPSRAARAPPSRQRHSARACRPPMPAGWTAGRPPSGAATGPDMPSAGQPTNGMARSGAAHQALDPAQAGQGGQDKENGPVHHRTLPRPGRHGRPGETDTMGSSATAIGQAGRSRSSSWWRWVSAGSMPKRSAGWHRSGGRHRAGGPRRRAVRELVAYILPRDGRPRGAAVRTTDLLADVMFRSSDWARRRAGPRRTTSRSISGCSAGVALP